MGCPRRVSSRLLGERLSISYNGMHMKSHSPKGYICPLCLIANGESITDQLYSPGDLVHRDEVVTAIISAYQWANNPGNVIVFPIQHFENIYELPDEFALQVHRLVRKVAIAMKEAWSCDGISTRQHNEPAGNQDVWHYHMHVTPRYEGDNMYATLATTKALIDPEKRSEYAGQLRAAMG